MEAEPLDLRHLLNFSKQQSEGTTGRVCTSLHFQATPLPSQHRQFLNSLSVTAREARCAITRGEQYERGRADAKARTFPHTLGTHCTTSGYGDPILFAMASL